MAETDILVTRETKRSFGLVRGGLAVLMLGLPFLGRQRIRVTTERVIIEEGFWTKLRDDVEVFRIRDVVSKQAIWHRMLGIGDVVIKATEGRTDESHVLRGVPDPVAVSEAIRAAWNASGRPRTSTNLD
ncbi:MULTISPECIES: PH domain-containing protein [Roseomonadaceae]|uniref:PH domain-containing protein n=1 Tax=Falsiroseomonas oleicola TaxID=2801474 RepID=A0ABS6H5X7_9PROT|nr:PH domain-containing protein [Roseomonas oleicola]MBU8543854.1 PH domain-containing protein [Roseomonas oleicola]